MSTSRKEPTIAPVDRAAAADLYAIAASSLTLDRFSQSLFEQKLFENPRPREEEYGVYAARQGGQLIGFMQSVIRPKAAKAWMGLWAVAARHRRRGVGSALFNAVRRRWVDMGAKEAEVLAIPGNYFNPGIDPRYTPAVCFVERLGFRRVKDCVNLVARLRHRFDTSAEEQALADRGITIRRAEPGDSARGGLLDAFFARDFGPDWRLEAGLAMRNPPPGGPGLHLAIRDGQIIAFSAHSSQNQEWGFFGPMGTTPQCRGLGIGRVLLLCCLNDLHEAGHETAIIPWVGPIGFYACNCDCVVDRVFWRYQIALNP